MSRRWLLSLLCLLVVVVFAQLSAARNGLRLNEAATRFLIQDETIVLLEVVNPVTQSLRVHLKLELLDPTDVTRGMAVRELALQPGVNKLSIPLTLTARSLNEDDDQALPWYRLRYRIDSSPTAQPGIDAASGVISLSEIDTPDIFALEVSAAGKTHRGARYYTRIRTFNPLTAKPVKDVHVGVELKFDDQAAPGIIRGSGITDATGYALVTLNIPARLSSDEGELKVVARHGGYIQEASNDIELDDQARIMLTTDKPIYQPGQPLHLRALVFDSTNHAAANAQATLKITDPEDTTVFQTTLITSRYGVASADWVIPENTRLGDYSLRVEMGDENYGDSEGVQTVKISRYDLPNFAVSVRPDRPYYLPQQNADIEVRADYLFGQPVKRGHVRVVREEERRWNFREQKWDIEGGDTYEGQTDESGRFVAHVDLTTAHRELADEEYSRFTDLTFAAYFTDPTTNRTEQRRFDVRVTKDAIHIYVAEGRYRQAVGFPLQFFLATSFADGTPVGCDVAISELPDGHQPGTSLPVLRTIRTNKYGIAKVSGLKLPVSERLGSSSLDFTARAGVQQTGHHTESFYSHEVPVIRVETDKALYRPGEMIKVSITASEPEMNLIVDVLHGSDILESRSLLLNKGTATFTLRPRPAFQDEVTIFAYSKSGEHSYDFPFGSRTVLFPRDRDLKINFRLDQANYQPGEGATVDFRISTPDGRPATSALGVVVFDRAVEERARTDREYRGSFGFSGSFNQWQGYDDQVGGITRRDLQRIDLSKPVAEEIELVAELLLGSSSIRPQFFSAETLETDHTRVFARLTGLQTQPIGDLLERQYKNDGIYPANGASLRRLLFESGVDFDQLRDPWGTPYRETYSIDQSDCVLEVVSAGPDKIFATKDDFPVTRIARPYFRFTGEAISRALAAFHVRTGGFVRDAATLKNELRTEGIDFDSLRDPWGQPYNLSLTTKQDKFHATVWSSGPDKRIGDTDSKSDDFPLWITSIDYLVETRARMGNALDKYFKQTNSLPGDDLELQRVFIASGFDQDWLRDPWGRQFYSTYETENSNVTRPVIRSVSTYGQPLKDQLEFTPVKQQVRSIHLHSTGEDGKQGTADDFDVATFSRLTEESNHGPMILQRATQPLYTGAKGAIKGTVTDFAGAVVPGVTVTATMKNSSQAFETQTDDAGRFILRNLPVGLYELRCNAAGFKPAVIVDVPVNSSNTTKIDLMLEVGGVSETVNISAEASMVNTTSSSIASSVTEGRFRVSIGQPVQIATPRLREYFPETLVWQPSLETDEQGRAQLKFKLADNITTWKMSVIGSTADGEIGTAETEIRAFQPFFVEHDPPRVLTEGDQISLPVVLRNYLERAQTIDLEIKHESWFTLQGPARQRTDVSAGDAMRRTFELTAVASVKDGKQRITASGTEASDAIEKPVTVHPDGEEKTQTASAVFNEAVTLNMDLPASVIPNSTQGELKIYPSLLTHVVESIEGILERPHGCGEQTISSTYPSLLVLRSQRQAATDPGLRTKARRYAQQGYQRLLNYRTEAGGFSYWGQGQADLALSAYALRFLHDAGEFVDVDDEVVKGLREWLLKQQRGDGSWTTSDYHSGSTENHRGTALLTAFVARVLAMTERGVKPSSPNDPKQPALRPVSPGLQRALSYLSTRFEAIDEPHLIASYALAAIAAGDTAGALRAGERLLKLARTEGETVFWSLDTNTPFHGWGLAGRVETTALAIQALTGLAKIQSNQTMPNTASIDPLVRGGLLYLLRQKDRYGVWYSTQATINVLDTLVTLLAVDSAPDRTDARPTLVDVLINGRLAASVKLPVGNQTTGLIRADVSRFLHNGANRFELRRPPGSEYTSIQLVANYYVPWSGRSTTVATVGKPVEPGPLRLSATFDKTTAKVNDEIVCHVKAERVDPMGYGMMLAEIGLPPGADVDRASLDNVVKNFGGGVSQYDVLPDRVLLYLWPRTGGVEFRFRFRPRLALTAKTAPSVVYDYYNPEARTVVEPVQFVVR